MCRLQDGISTGCLNLPDAKTNTYALINEMWRTSRLFSLSCRFDLCSKSLMNQGLYKQPVIGEFKLVYLGVRGDGNREMGETFYRYSSTAVGVGKHHR